MHAPFPLLAVEGANPAALAGPAGATVRGEWLLRVPPVRQPVSTFIRGRGAFLSMAQKFLSIYPPAVMPKNLL